MSPRFPSPAFLNSREVHHRTRKFLQRPHQSKVSGNYVLCNLQGWWCLLLGIVFRTGLYRKDSWFYWCSGPRPLNCTQLLLCSSSLQEEGCITQHHTKGLTYLPYKRSYLSKECSTREMYAVCFLSKRHERSMAEILTSCFKNHSIDNLKSFNEDCMQGGFPCLKRLSC